MIDNVNVPAVKQELASLAKVASEGMRIINQLTQDRYAVDGEMKQEMRDMCLNIARQHIEAFEKKEILVYAPMTLEAALKMLVKLASDDDAIAVEYARMHQDLMMDLTEVVEKVRLITMSNDELLFETDELRQAEAVEEARHN